MSSTRIGRRMRELHAIVSAAPGLSKAAVLCAAGLPDRGLGAYRPIERTLAAELVIAEKAGPRRCHLFASERDRKLWHLRSEMLGDSTPERASEILAEVEVMRARAAADYAAASPVLGRYDSEHDI